MRKNTIFLMLYEVAMYLAPLITAPYIARVLGTYGTGIYSYTYSIASYFILFIQLGVSLYGRREIASKKRKKEVSITFFEIFISISIMFTLVSILYFIMMYGVFYEYKKYLIFQYFMLISAWLDISWLFFGLEDFKVAVSRNLIVKFLSMILVFIFIKNSTYISKYKINMTLSNLLCVVVMWISIRKHINIVKVSKKGIFKHFKGLLKLFVPVLAIQLYSITDKLCLGLISTVDSVGIYENVYKISRVPVSVITAIGTVMLPRITKIVSSGEKTQAKKYIDKSLSITLIFAIGCAFGLIAVSANFVLLYLGKDFKEGINVLKLLSLVLMFIAWGNVFRMQYILPNKLDNIYIKSVIIGAVVNIVLNLALIPKYSGTGAAIASVIAEFIICFYQSYCIRDEFNFKKIFKENFIYLLSGLIMLCFVQYVVSLLKLKVFYMLFLQILAGVVIYFISIVVFESITKRYILVDEIKRMYLILRKGRKND